MHSAMLAVSRGHDIGRDDTGFYARQRHTKLVGPAKELRDLAATAYGREYQLGLRIDTLAITGARPSQAVRLRVEDFHYHSDDISRKALLQHDEEPQTVVSDNVIALAS
jgi:integrase